MVKKTSCLIFLILLVQAGAFAQEKRSLTHKDYDTWESISQENISKDGQWVGYHIYPQEGDGRVELVSHADPEKRYNVARGEKWQFSHDSQYAVGHILAEKDSIRALKLRKTKKEDLPKDSLFILDLKSGLTEKLPRIKSYSSPEKNGNWLAVHFAKEKKEQTDPMDSAQVKDTSQWSKKSKGSTLKVRCFDGKNSWTFEKVSAYGFSEGGEYLFYVSENEDSLKTKALHLLQLPTGKQKTIDEGKMAFISPTFSQTGTYLGFLSTGDSTKAKRPDYELYLYNTDKEDLQKVADKNSKGLLEDGRISKHGDLFFSAAEDRLYFGTASDYLVYPYEEDTTLLDEERVNLDIWGWQDEEIQPMQLKNREEEKKKSFLASYHIKNNKLLQIGDGNINRFHLNKKAKHHMALAFDDASYRRNYSWDIQIGTDVYKVDLETGARELIEKEVVGSPVLSPAGKYAYWYDNRDSTWIAYDMEEGKKMSLTEPLDIPFYNELHDSPSLPGSYGSAGWLEEDQAILIYDKYDIWSLDPKGKREPVNLTLGTGREQGIEFRRVKLDREEEGIDPKEDLYLSAFHEREKSSGYFMGDYQAKNEPQQLVFTDHQYFGLKKAEEADNFLFRRSTYRDFPEVYASGARIEELRQLSYSNPQQQEFNWGSVELVDYLANDGTPLQGLLFKPEGFDMVKKYPLIVYFYERSSDGLHSYRPPVPSASIINIPFFVSNGYLVFVPDIKYELGLPGPSAYDCVVPGVQSIVARGFVDKENMAIQGQSWGGYQVAYLITRTDMFKAAGAGAPVVNMTSAYGGIRWGTGMSRMFQYEQTQSRIGGTLWEKPLYYIENSPLFFMDRVNTPVLIMHNDEDGAVPWYQGIEMFMALKRLNKPSWLLQYNGEDHNLKERKNRKDLSIRLSQFFDHYLKGAPAPRWMSEGLPAVEKGRTLRYELE